MVGAWSLQAPMGGRDPYKTSVGWKESIKGCIFLGTTVAQPEDAQSCKKCHAHDRVPSLGV